MDKLQYRLMQAYGGMSPEARLLLVKYAEALMEKCPAPQVVPLRLVSSRSDSD